MLPRTTWVAWFEWQDTRFRLLDKKWFAVREGTRALDPMGARTIWEALLGPADRFPVESDASTSKRNGTFEIGEEG